MIKYTIPTGYLFIDDYSKGQLETLSIGDYGKKYNVKANFLGYDKLINGVPNVSCMPLSEKWVVTLSTQFGCCCRCNFCSPSGTKINTINGDIAIENIKVGDIVIGYDTEKKIIRLQTVQELVQKEIDDKLIVIELENDKILKLTQEHEVFLKNGEIKQAKELTDKDEIIDF